jgi:hypothetical protein
MHLETLTVAALTGIVLLAPARAGEGRGGSEETVIRRKHLPKARHLAEAVSTFFSGSNLVTGEGSWEPIGPVNSSFDPSSKY